METEVITCGTFPNPSVPILVVGCTGQLDMYAHPYMMAFAILSLLASILRNPG